MTVVPAGNRTALLICDQCGTENTVREATHDGELVWPLISAEGWTGSAFPLGPHRCPECTDSPRAEPETSGRTRSYSASYDVRRYDHAMVITPLADLDAELADCLRDELMRAAATVPHVVVDLHGVGFIDSAALGLLVRARQEARQHGASFNLAAPSRFVLTVLHTMRLDAAFRIFPDQESALGSLSAHHPATRPTR